MGKREKFLKELSLNLGEVKDKDKIVDKYTTLIYKRIKDGEKFDDIVKSLGSISSIVKKETTKKDFIKDVHNFLKKIIIKIKKFFFKLFSKIKKTNENKSVPSTLKINNNKKFWLIFLEVFLFLLASYIAIFFMVSVLAVMDGVKVYGITIVLFSILSINFIFIDIVNKKRLGIQYNIRKYYMIIVFLIIMIASGVAYTTYSYFKIDFVNVPNEKYNLTYKELTYRLVKGQKTDIYFNSWYKVSYSLNYDEELKNKVRIVVKYNESFYDLNSQNDEGDIYISLVNDKRDMISMYINNLKDNKIYNEKELSRYLIKIYVNEDDYKRLVIHN